MLGLLASNEFDAMKTCMLEWQAWSAPRATGGIVWWGTWQWPDAV